MLIIDGIRYEFQKLLPASTSNPDDPDDLKFHEERTERPRCLTYREFQELYCAGNIVWPDPLVHPGDRTGEGDHTDCPQRRVRTILLNKFDASPVPRSTEPLREFIARVAVEEPEVEYWTPSPHSLRRWLRERGEPGNRKPHYMGDRRRRGPRGSRMPPVVQEVMAECEEAFWKNRRQSKKDVHALVTARLREINEVRVSEGKTPFPIPSNATVWRRLGRGMTEQRAKSRFGGRKAQRLKAVQGGMQAKRILERVIMDSTRIDCFVVDDSHRYVIGRPWLTIALDVHSRLPLGFHIHFDNPGVGTAMATLRMAVRPKLDLRQRFPDLRADWEAFGVPHNLVVDNAWEYTGSSFPDACADANINIEWTPVGEPRWKAIGERFFKTLNDQLIHKLPGSAPGKPHVLKELELDPQADACLTICQLEELICLHVVNIYAVEEHDGIEDRPLHVWRKGVRARHLTFAGNLPALQMALTKQQIKDRRLTHEGVRFRSLVYRSEEVTGLIMDLYRPGRGVRFGTAKISKIRYRPEDLSSIYVWNEVRGTYVELPCTKPEYAAGLSEHLHDLLRKEHRQEKLAFLSDEELCMRRARLLHKIASIADAGLIRDRQRAHRLLPPQPFPPTDTPDGLPGVAIGAAKNRRGGDRPEKAEVRSRKRAAANRSGSTKQLEYAESTPDKAAPKPLFDPFADFDRAAALEQARRRLS